MHRRFVQQQQGREAARLGDQRGMAQDHADQQRLLLAGAGERGGDAGRRVGSAPCRCGARPPMPNRPRRRGRGRRPGCARSQSSTASAGVAARRSAIGQASVMRATGKPGERRHGVHPGHQAHAGRRGRHGVAGHGVLQAGEPGRILAALGQQAVALRHGGVVRGDLPRVAGLQRPDQAIEEAAAAGKAFLEQPVHLRREPDRGDAGGDLAPGCAARRRRAGTRAGRAGRPGRCRCRYRPRRPRWRNGRRPPSRRRRRAAAGPRCARRAGHGRAPAGRPPPAGWSCRCRWVRTAR